MIDNRVYQALADALDRRWLNKSTWFEEGYNYQCTGLFKDEQAKFGNKGFAVGGAAKRMPEKTGGRWRDFFDWNLYADIDNYKELPIGSWVIWGEGLSKDGHIARLAGFVDGGIRVINQWGKDNKKNPDGSWQYAIGKHTNFKWCPKVKGVLIPKYSPEQALEALRKIDSDAARDFDKPVAPKPLQVIDLPPSIAKPPLPRRSPSLADQALSAPDGIPIGKTVEEIRDAWENRTPRSPVDVTRDLEMDVDKLASKSGMKLVGIQGGLVTLATGFAGVFDWVSNTFHGIDIPRQAEYFITIAIFGYIAYILQKRYKKKKLKKQQNQ